MAIKFVFLATNQIYSHSSHFLLSQKMIAISGMLCFISLVISAFSSHSLALLFVFQGFGLGLAMSLAMPLFMSLPSQWFLKNRGLASGIAVSGAGIGGGCASLIIRGLLPSLGYQNTLLVYASMNGCLCLGAWFLLDVRYPPRPKGEISGKPKRWFPLGVWRSPSIYLSVLRLRFQNYPTLTGVFFSA